ncbi:MAG: hypothetical protein D6830_05835 [Ignavibacteria bacterium]|nr:MAG: hypothetical protein D6830_05835 [Ignavibacteria bacterium]
MRIIILLLIISSVGIAQNRINNKSLHSKYAISSNRLTQDSILEGYKKDLISRPEKLNDKGIIHRLKEISLSMKRDSAAFNAVKNLLDKRKIFTPKVLCAAIECAKALFPGKFNQQIDSILIATNDKYVFTYAAMYHLHYPQLRDKDYILNLLKKKFPKEGDEYLNQFRQSIQNIKNLSEEEIVDLLSWEYQKHKTVIFTFFRNNRIYPGITIIRKPDGTFVRDEKDSIFYVQQLGLGVANLPGFMRYGNTPQGIFSVQGFYVSPTESIGPTPNVITRLPFEKPVEEYLHGKIHSSSWNEQVYSSLLPESLKDNGNMWEAYYAGKFGRRLLVMHGSTDDLDNYKNEIYYPLSPTKGCISSVEMWDSLGNNVLSDQSKLMNAYFSTGELKGFLVVINLDNKEESVAIKDILPFILKAERKLNSEK